MNARTARRAIIVLVALQAILLSMLPLLAGARMPEGSTVRLEATSTTPPGPKGADEPTNEIWLEYEFQDLDLPDGIDPGDTAYLELVDAEGDEPARYGTVVADPSELPSGSVWIKLLVEGPGEGRGTLETGPIGVWYDADRDRVDEVRDEIEEADGAAIVTVTLDNDGDPQITRVVAG